MNLRQLLPGIAAALAAFLSAASCTPKKDSAEVVAEPPASAKNVILFIADGMSTTLATAARIYEGQKLGGDGEEHLLAFEALPYTALVKTYAADAQIPDSAATASAINTGLMSNLGTVSVGAAPLADCAAARAGGDPVTIADHARGAGKAIGVVTTTIVQDATPAAVYAHSASRRWFADSRVPREVQALGCIDISRQLIEFAPEVVMGGGRIPLLPASARDPESGAAGQRDDGRDLMTEFQATGSGAAVITDVSELGVARSASIRRLMGIFAPWSMVFEADDLEEDKTDRNPSLAEMTATAIRVLERDGDGYFLMVEHEGTDDLQHGGRIVETLDATLEFSAAVGRALDMVDLDETLIVVTADHGQPIVFAGYAPKGNPILGLSAAVDEGGFTGDADIVEDGKPFATLGFYAGPRAAGEKERPDPRDVDRTSPDYRPTVAVPRHTVPHSGADVALYAGGPGAKAFHGVIHQTDIYDLILTAMGLSGGE